MKTYKLILLFTLVLALALAACSAGASTPDLKGTSWNLVAINDQPVLDDSAPTLVFEDGQVRGNGSCNSFGGEYTLDEGKLTFGSMFSTMMYCEGLSDQESAYLQALEAAASYQVKDNNLHILNTDGDVILTFAAQ